MSVISSTSRNFMRLHLNLGVLTRRWAMRLSPVSVQVSANEPTRPKLTPSKLTPRGRVSDLPRSDSTAIFFAAKQATIVRLKIFHGGGPAQPHSRSDTIRCQMPTPNSYNITVIMLGRDPYCHSERRSEARGQDAPDTVDVRG